MYCSKCGTQNPAEASFCIKCGNNLNPIKPEIERKGITGNLGKIGVYGFRSGKTWKMALAVIVYSYIGLFLLGIIFGMGYPTNSASNSFQSTTITEITSTPTDTPNPTDRPTLEETNIQISKEVVEEYHQTHSYYGNDIFVCSDMASGVWDMLKTRGVNAKIAIGNVDKDNAKLLESNHAWVLAETSPDTWLALETTGGYVVYSTDNPRYYKGWVFYTPKQLKEYLQLLTQYNDQLSKYNDATAQYNSLVSQYNQANGITKLTLSSQLNTQATIVEQRANDFKETVTKMLALVTY